MVIICKKKRNFELDIEGIKQCIKNNPKYSILWDDVTNDREIDKAVREQYYSFRYTSSTHSEIFQINKKTNENHRCNHYVVTWYPLSKEYDNNKNGHIEAMNSLKSMLSDLKIHYDVDLFS